MTAKRIFSVNVKGLLFTVQKATPLLQDDGSIGLTVSTVQTPHVLAKWSFTCRSLSLSKSVFFALI